MAYAKAFVAFLMAMASALVPLLAGAGSGGWVNTAIAGASAVAVYRAPNVHFSPTSKAWIAAIMAVLTVVASRLSDGVFDGNDWLQVLIAVGAAIGVWAVPNNPATLNPRHGG